MKKLLLLGTSLASIEIVQTAKEMGCYTVVTDNLMPELSPAKKVADEYWMISTDDLDTLEKKCREEEISGVFAGVSEFNLDMVKALTARLDLPCYIETEPWKYARNKHAFKEKCREIGIPVVEEYKLSDPPLADELIGIEYPVVVKPVDSNGNRGLSFCYNEAELIKGCENARNYSESKNLLVERYVKGEETVHYYYLAEGEARHVYSGTLFRQPGYPTFLYSFATTTSRFIQEYEEHINEKCIALLKAIGCRKGIALFQFISDDQGRYYALEMAQRISAGGSGKSIKNVTGVNSIEWLLNIALGKENKTEDLPPTMLPPYETSHCCYFLFAERADRIASMQGINELDDNEFQINVIEHQGSYVNKYRNMVRIVFNARNGKEMCEKIQKINSTIKILNDDGDNMFIHFTDYDQIIESNKGLFLNE